MTASGSDVFLTGQALARNIPRLLERQGLSLEDLSRKSGHPVSVLEKIMRGDSGGIELTVLQDFAVALGTDARELTQLHPKDA